MSLWHYDNLLGHSKKPNEGNQKSEEDAMSYDDPPLWESQWIIIIIIIIVIACKS
jgi:hypothetical protein